MPRRVCVADQFDGDHVGSATGSGRLLLLLGRNAKFELGGQRGLATPAFCASGCSWPSSVQSLREPLDEPHSAPCNCHFKIYQPKNQPKQVTITLLN